MIEEKYPKEFVMRDQNKYLYRYPGGEVRAAADPLEGFRVTSLQQMCTIPVSIVLPGPGSAAGAGDYGAGATGKCSGHLPSGCHALLAGLFPGQRRR